MTAKDLKKKYFDFFVRRGHKKLPNFSLVPENDPSALFISAGMHPLVPYLLGESHPSGKRLVSNQRCLRTDDIDEVGNNRHLTFMEMLGNWSLGDYFKKEQLNWAFEFLTSPQWLALDPQKIYVSIFEGDKDAPRDEESIIIWQEIYKKLEIKAKVGERIVPYPKKKNWWGPVGETGPCGPDSEIFYKTGKPHDPSFGKKCHINCDCGRFVEIWNNVFMEYNKTIEGKYEKLKKQNVDTGMGSERVAAVLQGKETVFEIELFSPIINQLEKLSKRDYAQNGRPFRIIADHLRAATFIISDGVLPSNKEQGYVLRRLIRRAIRYGRTLQIKEVFTPEVAEVVIKIMREEYPELEKNKKEILGALEDEEKRFQKTISRGLKQIEKHKKLDGKIAFYLYETYGFPLELTEEIAHERGQEINEQVFKKEFGEHQELSRKGAAQKFTGGLADHSEEVTKLHTATHLLQAALRKVLGEEVSQKGSNITAKRLRFDFSWKEKLNPEQIKQVEDLVSQIIKKNLPVEMEIMLFETAKKQGAMAVFGQKYGEEVKTYRVGLKEKPFSFEVCGGPHIDFTGKLGKFKIMKEEAVGSGTRRLYAKLEQSA